MSQAGDELEPRSKAGLELFARRARHLNSVRSNNIYIPEAAHPNGSSETHKHMVVPREVM